LSGGRVTPAALSVPPILFEAMLESLREAFRQALDNFYAELNRDRVPEAADGLLRAMKAELIELGKQTADLEKELGGVEHEARQEHEAAKTCIRREEMAKRIGDGDTASVAREFAKRHLRRYEILSEKTEVLRQEIDERYTSFREMKTQFHEARLRRETLISTAGRAEPRDRIRQTDDLFAEMERMAERIENLEAEAEAAEVVGEVLRDEPSNDSTAEKGDLDARLEALKRRMAEG
jgi:phage shock protein A